MKITCMTNERLKQIADDLVEKRIDESKYTELYDLKNFPIVTLQELNQMYRAKKISFIFKSDDRLLKQYGARKILKIENSLTSFHGLFIILAIAFSLFYSIKYSDYIVLTAIPLLFISVALASPYQKLKKPLLIISIFLLVSCFFIKTIPAIIIMLLFSCGTILTNIVRKVNQTMMSSLILNNELAFVQGYINNFFSIKNEKNKKIIFNCAPESLQKQLVREFEEGLTV